MNKVMMIDDDVFMTRLYSTLLQNDGFQVTVVNSGEEALQQLKSAMPDVVVLDLHMPGINGVEIFRYIRGNTRLKDLPVIVFSNGYIKSLIDEAGGLNPQKVLSKLHYTPKKLIEEIRDTLEAKPESKATVSSCSALESAVQHVPDEAIHQLPTWLQRMHADTRQEARRVCLIHVYKIMQHTLQRAVSAEETSPRGKLGRAVKKLLNDLFDNPDHITESTMQTLEHALKKMNELCGKLESEAALRDVLADLDA